MSVESAAKIDAEAQRWVVRLDRGLTSDEQAVLDAWLAGDDRRRGALVRAQAAWSLLDRARALGDAEEIGRRSVPEPRLADAIWTRRRAVGIAACAVVAMAAAAGLVQTTWRNGQAFATTTGEVRRLPLEDGSLAMINSASEIRLAFKADRRDVELRYGEAWFKVAKNPERPFTVAVGPVRVEAVGTAFDLRRRNGHAEVTVTEGVVKVWSAADEGETMFVRAGHRAVLGEGVGFQVVALSAEALDQQLAWQEGRIILDDMTLAAAAAEFNRYSDVKLQVAPALANQQMVGSFRFDDLDGFVDAAATLVGARVERDGSVVRILP